MPAVTESDDVMVPKLKCSLKQLSCFPETVISVLSTYNETSSGMFPESWQKVFWHV